MLTNYLKITLRSLVRHRLFTLINVVSLSAGLFVAYTAICYIQYETSYDNFHENAGSVYRLARTYRSQDYSVIGFPNWSEASASDQQQQARSLKNMTGIQEASQFIIANVPEFVDTGDRRIQAEDLLTTNTPAAFCSMFSWALRQGSFQNFADGWNKIILTASSARKLFGLDAPDRADLIQKRVKIAGTDYTLAAIIDDVPLNSHINFTMVLSQPRINYWGSRMYVQLKPDYDQVTAEKSINEAISLLNPALAQDPLYKRHFLQPIPSIHLESNILYETKPPGNKGYIIMIGCFGVFVLGITLFNYANLSLALKSRQSKAIGVRKTLGATRFSVTLGLVSESILLSIMVIPVVVLLSIVLIPYVNAFMGVHIDTRVYGNWQLPLILLPLAVGMGTLAGVFPATLLAGRRVVDLFGSTLRNTRYQRLSVRNYLVICQFVVLIVISSVSYFVVRQIQFVERKNLGFRQKNVLYAYSSPEKQNLFQEKLRQLPGIEAVGNGSSFGIMPYNQVTYKLEGAETVYDDAQQLYLDYDAVSIYNLTVFPGGLTPKNLPKNGVIINKTAAAKIARSQRITTDELIGKTVITEPEYRAENGQTGFPFVVAGIFDDINLFSLHEQITPYFIRLSENIRLDGRTIIQYDPAAAPHLLADVKGVYDSLNESFPLETAYLDQQVKNLYAQDRQTANLLLCLNTIAVFLAGLGLTGLAVFLTMARIKEIGIRKVLGATPLSIIWSSLREYVWLVGLALLISVPIGYYAATEWLENFAYHVDIQPVAFAGAGLLTFLLTALIVSTVAYRAALMNPVKSLRSE
ncbi:MAG: ABC transporter permease [Spirosoma sp.]|nr:ABC transporter permease [Spirosoma sp.]